MKFIDNQSECWGKRDDIIELNMQKLRLTSKVESCSSLIDTLNKIALKGNLDLNELNLNTYKTFCNEIEYYENTLGLRWSKTVLVTLENAVLYLNTTSNVKALDLLRSILSNYLVFQFIVPKVVFKNHMPIIEKFISSIFESTLMHDGNEYLEVSLFFILNISLFKICFFCRLSIVSWN